jgi:hypothetical protein
MKRGTKAALTAGILLLALVGAAVVVLPRIVRAKCEEAARAHGIDLTIGSVSLWFGSATFSEVDAKSADAGLPLALHAREVKVSLEGLSPRAVDVSDASATIDGPLVEVAKALEEVRAKQAAEPQAPEPSRVAITRVDVRGAHVRWTRALGPSTALDASGVDVSLALGAGERLESTKIVAPRVAIEGPARGALGPVRVEATSTAPDLRLATSTQASAVVTVSDPDPTHRATARYELAGNDKTLDVDVARDHLSRYGFGPLAPGKDPEVSVKLHAVNGKVTHGTFAYGPFRGTLSGAIAPEVPSAHLAYATDPVPCAEIARDLATQVGGPLGGLAAQLGSKVTGEARAVGEIVWDAREAGASHLTFVPSADCGVF